MLNETNEKDVIKCPWCGFIDGDAWERQDEGKDICGQCGKAFRWSRHTAITYTATPISIESYNTKSA